MGLDNGIVMKKIKKENVLKFPAFVKYEMWDNMQHNAEFVDVEIAYWRKCWGIRDVIMDILHGYNQDYTPIDQEDIQPILRHLYNFCSKEYWDENADSIWEFEDMIPNLIQQLINLTWLKDYMKEHPEVTCHFYDSY